MHKEQGTRAGMESTAPAGGGDRSVAVRYIYEGIYYLFMCFLVGVVSVLMFFSGSCLSCVLSRVCDEAWFREADSGTEQPSDTLSDSDLTPMWCY